MSLNELFDWWRYGNHPQRNKIEKILELVGGRSKPAVQLRGELVKQSPEQIHEALLEAIRTCARDDVRGK